MSGHRIAFFINPIAGMGGRVGLKGTDGKAEAARVLGAEPVSPDRARLALVELFTSVMDLGGLILEVMTAGSPMGEDECRAALERASDVRADHGTDREMDRDQGEKGTGRARRGTDADMGAVGTGTAGCWRGTDADMDARATGSERGVGTEPVPNGGKDAATVASPDPPGNASRSRLHGSAPPITLRTIYRPEPGGPTTRNDTLAFCTRAMEEGAEIILFAGGDGTARDVVSVTGERIPILGIPSGVKMHSGVFTFRPDDAGRALFSFLGGTGPLETRDVMDLDEDEYRAGNIRTRLYGYALVPVTTVLQGCKNVVVTPDEQGERESIAQGLEEVFRDHSGLYVMGAGSTIRDVGRHFRLDLSPLGFDLVRVGPPRGRGSGVVERGGDGERGEGGDYHLVAKDVNEAAILENMARVPREHRYIVVTPIGAQGFILGRGTQVISERVLDLIPPENLMVVATPGKLAITDTLRLDAGRFNGILKGFRRVLTGYRQFSWKKVV